MVSAGISTEQTINALVVNTKSARALERVSNLLRLFDSKKLYFIKTVVRGAHPKNILAQFIYHIDNNIALGTLTNPPKSKSKPVAIVDIYESNLIAIAPKRSVIEKIAKVIDKFKSPKNVSVTAIPKSEKELELTITLPEKVEITALIDLVGKQLGLNFLYDRKKVFGSVMLKVNKGKIKVKDTYALLESVLKFKNLAMTRRGNLVTIIPKAEALKYDPVFYDSTEQVKPGDLIVTSVFKLEHVTIGSAKIMLETMRLGLNINSIPETGTLIVTGYAYRMPRIEEMLEMIDMPGEHRKLQSRQLQYTVASAVALKVKTLADQLETVPVTISVKQTAPPKPQTAAQRRAARRRAAQRRTPKPKPKPKPLKPSERKGVYLDVDDRTNRIIMIGPQEDIDTVNTLIDAIDVPLQDLREIKEYEIQNVSAETIQNHLYDLGIIGKTNKPRQYPNTRRRRP